MVLGILTAVAACPAIVGMNETIQTSQKKQMKQMHREKKTNLIVTCSNSSPKGAELDGSYIVLRNHKVWISSKSK